MKMLVLIIFIVDVFVYLLKVMLDQIISVKVEKCNAGKFSKSRFMNVVRRNADVARKLSL